MKSSYFDKYAGIFAVCVVVWALIAGALSDVVDVDAAQYAAISMEMLLNDSYLIITERGLDYLDKPPFLFWINCISFKLFGFTNFAYKLPTILFSLLGLLYTYKLGAYLYNKNTGRVAAIIVGTSIGFLWANNDVKTDAIITACVVFSVYHLLLFLQKNTIINLIGASIGIGIGILTKGPMGLIFPCAIIFIHLVFKKDFKKLLRPSWIILPIIVGLISFPMLWGLYQQFDLHPEKVVDGKTGVSGLRFFFWEQSFGRITGENKWKNETSFFYLFHSLFLLIFPYSIVALVAYYKKIKRALSKKYWGEMTLLGGSLLILIALSLSSYKIPHYAIVLFPFVAIIAASELNKMLKAQSTKWIGLHNKIIMALMLIAAIGSFVCFEFSWLQLITLVLLVALQISLQKKSRHLEALVVIALSLGFMFNVHIVPSLQQYSQGRKFAELIEENNLEKENLYFFNRESRAMEFYLNRRISEVSWHELLEKQSKRENAWYYMSLDGKEALLNAGLKIEGEIELMQYDINRIQLGFLNPKTREQHLDPRYLIKFKTN